MHKIYGLFVWFVATLFVVYSFCLNTASAVFSESIKASLHTSNLGVSIATGAFILGFACMQIPAGYLLDKFNARFVVSSGVFLLALGNVCISFSDNLLVYALSNLLQGIGASFAFIAAAVLIAQWFPAKSFPILFGLTQAISCILAGFFHYYFTISLMTHSWNDIYRGLALFGFILLFFTLAIVKSPSGYAAEKLSLTKSLVTVFKNKQILLCSIAAATSFGVLLAYASFWYLPVQSYYSVAKSQAVITSGILFAGIGIGTPLLAWFSNYIKSRLIVIHTTVCIGTMVLLLCLYLPHYQINTLIIIKTLSFLLGFFLSGAMLLYTMVSELSDNKTRGVAISLLNTMVFLFNILLLFMPYLSITKTSVDFFTYLWILPFFTLFSILLVYFAKETYR